MTRVLAPAGDVRTTLGSVQRVLTYTAGGSVNWYKISGGTLAVYIKRLKKKIIPFHPVNLFLGIQLIDIIRDLVRNQCPKIITKSWKLLKCSRVLVKLWCIHMDGVEIIH